MFKAFSKVVVVTLMLIAFVGQALAYSAMSCEMSSDYHESHSDMSHSKMGHHDGMNHGEMNESSNGQTEDCCGIDCACPANACTSTIALSSINSTDTPLLSDSVNLHQSEQPKTIPSSLYRPPIFA